MDLTFVNVCSLLRIGSHQSSRSIRSRRRVVVRLLLLSAAAALLLVPTGSAQVVMNEMMSSNQTTIADGEGDFSDWLELLNTGSEVLSLSGYGLSDRLDDPFRWTFPDVALEPGAFLLVWASGKDRSEPGEPLHASFRIAADGEHVILTAPDGTTADVLDPIAVPVDVSLGRWPDGSGDRYFFTDPTPGAPNASPAFSRTLNPPSFSHEAGFHADAFSLSLASGDSSAVIRFTLD
ncbi:MAG: lamin tail domain-containing protein, partial [Bacteroidota bacterium]